MNTTTNHLTFTAEELTALTLATTRAFFETGTRTRWTVEGQDGDAWAALEAYQDQGPFAGYGWELVSTIQLTDEPGRRFVVLACDGRDEIASGDDLSDILAALFNPNTAEA